MPVTCAEPPADTLLLVLNGAEPPVQLTVKGKLSAGSGLGPPVTVLLTVKVPGSGEKLATTAMSAFVGVKVQLFVFWPWLQVAPVQPVKLQPGVVVVTWQVLETPLATGDGVQLALPPLTTPPPTGLTVAVTL